MKIQILIYLSIWSCVAFAADTELTNYKSGIDLNFGDSAGSATDKTVAYMEEYLYYDKEVSDRKTVYILSTTDVTASHNSRNIAGNDDGTREYEAVGTGQGQIIYKVDGDGRFEVIPNDGDWTDYSAAFAFEDINYGIYGDSGVDVLGTTGDNGVTQSVANRTSFYHRGIVDSVGDEWHTLTFADDDTGYGSIVADFSSSDGKIWYFVVDPLTPCLTWRVSGDGEFYTTPAKKYFIPKIYDQTTYFAASTGGVTVEIHALDGSNINYRIVDDPNASTGTSPYTAVGSDNITLDDDDFADGTQYLQYYYNASYIKTRTVVKNPDYPSSGEAHGDRFWLNESDNWTNDILPRLSTYPTDSSDDDWLETWETSNFWSLETELLANARTGVRYIGSPAAEKAILAHVHGWTATRSGGTTSYADLAKLALFETKATLDPVGMELQQNYDAIPSREIIYRGYWDFEEFAENAMAYDLLIANYKRSQYAGGISEIEDYFIRDCFARYVHWASLDVAYYTNSADPGMWDTARRVGACWVAAAMPGYDTDYFGTSGIDGTTTTTLDNPFPSVAHTWEDLFFTSNYTVSAFPDPAKPMGVETWQSTSEGKFNDRIRYSATSLQGAALVSYWLIMAQYASDVALPYSELVMGNAAAGTLYGTVLTGAPGSEDYLPNFRAWSALQNSWYPDFRDVAQPTMLALADTQDESLEKQGRYFQPFAQIYYNHNFTGQEVSVQNPSPLRSDGSGRFQTQLLSDDSGNVRVSLSQ